MRKSEPVLRKKPDFLKLAVLLCTAALNVCLVLVFPCFAILPVALLSMRIVKNPVSGLTFGTVKG